MEFSHYYFLLGVYISILPCLLGLYLFKKLDPAFQFLVLMLCVETGVAIYSRHLQAQGINNLPSLHLLTFFELIFGGMFFHQILTTTSVKRFVVICIVLFSIYTGINSFFIQDIYTHNQIPRTIEGYLFVVFSFLYLYQLFRQSQLVELSKLPEFWTVIAFLGCFGTTQFVNLFSNYLVNNIEHYRSFYLLLGMVNRTMVILFYGTLTMALWKKKLQIT